VTESLKEWSDHLTSIGVRLVAIDDAWQPWQKSAKAKPRDLLTVKQAAVEFNISTRSLYRWKHLHTKLGRAVRIRRSDLENYLRADLFR